MLEDDVIFCPSTPRYILNAMELDSNGRNINLLHLSRGTHGIMIKTSFLMQFIELLEESQINQMNTNDDMGVDVVMTKLFYEKNHHFDIFYSRYNMMHHPLISLNPSAQQHRRNISKQRNPPFCYNIGKRIRAKQLNYINPFNMNVAFERLTLKQ